MVGTAFLAASVQAQTASVESTDAAAPPADAPINPIPDYSGDLGIRPALTGDWGGSRSSLADKGVQFELSLVETWQGVVDGGLDSGFESVGSLEYGLRLDFQKMGVWPGATLYVRGESRFGNSVNTETGSLVPVNTDALFPVPGEDSSALTDFNLTQFLSPSLAVIIGKFNTLNGDINEFAHGRGENQFMNLAFVANPITLRTIPYSGLGAALLILPTPDSSISFTVIDAEGQPDESGFDTIFNGATAYGLEARTATNFFDRPGHQLVGVTWSSRDFLNLEQDPRIILNILPNVTIAPEEDDGAWSVYYNFDQYVWQDETSGRGWGLFGRLGYADPDTNPIEFMASIGVGGTGPFESRPRDTFGIGYYALYGSDDIPGFLNIDDTAGMEAFYNVEVTPALHVTLDVQLIDPGALGADDAVIFGVRVKAVF